MNTLAFPDPPNSSLMITGSPHLSNIIYEGDNLTLSCTVNGGKPVNATVITFGCPNKTDTPDSFNSSSITSSLMFLPVKPENHGSCVCNSRWKESNWYDKTVSWNITVYCELHTVSTFIAFTVYCDVFPLICRFPRFNNIRCFRH